MKKVKKIFISFEGPEASGKSSQILLLKNYFKKNKIPFLVTREPGGTIIAETLRKIILNKKNNLSNLEEILLLMTARFNHIEKIIKPALKKGKIVISDRFADSTFVYQGYVNNYGISRTQNLHKILLENFKHNKTFLFVLPPEEIVYRLSKRKNKNKYDKSDIKFHEKVSLGYKKISNDKKRFILIDGLKNKKDIHKKILKYINS